MDFEATKNPYEHYEQTVHRFTGLVTKKKEMEETFHPSMVKDYNAVKNDMVTNAVELLRLGIQRRLDQESVYLTVDDTEYKISRADMMKVINKNQWDELFPMDNVQVIHAQIDDAKESEENDESLEQNGYSQGYADPAGTTVQNNPLVAFFQALYAPLMNGGSGGGDPNEAVLALRDAFQPYPVYLVDEVGGIQRKILKLERERDDAERKCVSYKQALESAAADAEEAEARHDEELKNATAEAQKKIEELSAKADKEKNKAENAFKEKSALQSEVGRLNKLVDEGKNELSKTKDNLQKKIDDANKNSTELSRKLDEATRKADDANRKIEDANRRADEAGKRADEANKRADDASRKAQDDARKAEDNLRNSVQKAKDEASKNFDRMVSEKDKRIAELEKKLKEAENNDAAVKEYEDKLKAKDREYADLKKKYDDLSKEADSGKKVQGELREKVKTLEQERTSLEELAYYDRKIKVFNNNAFNRDFQQVDKNTTSLVVAGVRNMKEINDKYGRQSGDKLIQIAGEQYRKEFGDNVYRVFGDEFAIITKDDFNTIINKLQGIKETLEAQQIFIVYGVSVGAKAANIKAMVSEAENAMVAMKNNPTMGGAIPQTAAPKDNKPKQAEPEEVDMSELLEEYMSTEN